MLRGQVFRESLTRSELGLPVLTSPQEGTDHVDFSEDEPETIQMMLEYLYSGRYFSDSGCGCEADVEMIDNQAIQTVRETSSEITAVSRPTKDSEAKLRISKYTPSPIASDWRG